MKIFIFEYVGELTSSYHCDGGLVIVARDEDQAKKMADADSYINLTENEWKEVRVYDLDPRALYEERMFVFPDAGCC